MPKPLQAEVKPGEWVEVTLGPTPGVRLFGVLPRVDRDGNPVLYERIFHVGDMAEYAYHNIVFFGPILKISQKTVTIKEGYSERKHRLSLEKFQWRNWNFSEEQARSDNHFAMMNT